MTNFIITLAILMACIWLFKESMRMRKNVKDNYYCDRCKRREKCIRDNEPTCQAFKNWLKEF